MFAIHATTFGADSPIPKRHTCEGEDLSPPLMWSNPPEGTRSFALIVDDPDAPDPAAPKRIWVHWLRYNIPGDVRELSEGAGNGAPVAAMEAITDAGTRGYHGPCPPIGRHRYFFRLYALDATLPMLEADARRPELEAAMARHVLGTAVVMGTYEKSGAAKV